MTSDIESRAPEIHQSLGGPSGSHDRVARRAKKLAGSHTAVLAALDRFEESVPTPPMFPTGERSPSHPTPISPPPTPMAGFSGAGSEPAESGPPREEPRGNGAWLLLALLLGVLLSWTGADLVRPVTGESPLRVTLGCVPGLVLTTALLGAGGVLATTVTTPRRRDREAGTSSPRTGIVAPILLYTVVLGGAVLWSALWAVSTVSPGDAVGVTAASATVVLVVTASLTTLAIQIRYGRALAANERERGGAPRGGHGAPPAVPALPIPRRRWLSPEHRRRKRRRRMRAHARAALTSHTRAWEDIHHECRRRADRGGADTASLRTALDELGAVRPSDTEVERTSVALKFADPETEGSAVTAIRCLARYHPSPLENRFERINRAFRAEHAPGAGRGSG